MEQPTLWQAIDALATHMPLTPAKVKKAIGAHLQQQHRNKNFVHLKGKGLVLGGGITVSSVDLLMRPNAEFDPNSGLSIEVEGACVTLEDIRERYVDLEITQHPRGRSPLETTAYASKTEWGTLSFAFKQQTPDCLSRVSFRT